MRRLINFISFCLIFFFFAANAQTSEIDSLKNIISTQGEDSLKVNNLIALGTIYLGEDLQEAMRLGSEALELAEKIDYQKGRGYAYKLIGLVSVYKANYPEAVIQFQHSLAVFDSLAFKVGIANILSNLGVTYFNVGDDTKAIDFYLRSLRISEEVNDKVRIATVLNNIGGVYNNKPATVDKALEYFLKALQMFQEVDDRVGISTASMNVGELYYLKKKQYDSAIHYFETSLAIFDESVEATFPLTFLGEIYGQRNDYSRAYSYHNKAIKIAEGLDAKLELIQSIIGLAKTQKKHGQVKQSIISFRRAQLLAEEAIARRELKEIYEGLSHLYAYNRDFKNAHQYDTLLSSVKDSLYNNDNDTKIQQLQFNFDLEKKEDEIGLLTKDQALKAATIQRQRVVNYAAGITGFFLLMLLIGFYNRHRYTQKTNKIIKDERDRSKELLLNILPAETARELETNGHAQTRFYESVTVLFGDFKGFSYISRTLKPQELVAELNDYFIAFDEIVEKFNLEKIKTIGDAYMCAGGIPTANETHPFDAVEAGLAMQQFMTKRNAERKANGLEPWELRIGIHIGPIVAGVVGKKKYAYDIWGDTVNIASRMESSSEGGRVNISSSVYDFVKDRYACHYRGKIFAKNIGEIDMYFVESDNAR
jgi:adenylate cyclase